MKKAQGSSDNGRDSIGKRLGIKKNHHEYVRPGNILVRQRGFKWAKGRNVGVGRDYTIYSLVYGRVYFSSEKITLKRKVNVRKMTLEDWEDAIERRREKFARWALKMREIRVRKREKKAMIKAKRKEIIPAELV